MSAGARTKLSSGREAAQGDLALLRAFRKAIPRVAEDDFGLPLGLIGARQKRLLLADLADGIEDGWLLLSLSGSSLGLGAVCADPVLVAALVQQQTLGRVSDKISADRPLTGTDAALTAPLIDAILGKLREVSAYGLFRVDRRVTDARSLVLPMEAESYIRADLTIDINCGAHQGQVQFLFPEPPAPSSDTPERDPAERPVMRETAMVVQAEFRAVLARLSLPLEALTGLHKGQILPLADARMDRTELIAIDGRKVASGRLGQASGFRALRINPVGHKPPPLEDSFGPHRRQGPAALGVADPSDGDGLSVEDMTADEAVAEISELAGLSAPLSQDDVETALSMDAGSGADHDGLDRTQPGIGNLALDQS
ncbi:MAG: FliM/FliN family flagellar motor switch protein [Marinibacterium sp.]